MIFTRCSDKPIHSGDYIETSNAHRYYVEVKDMVIQDEKANSEYFKGVFYLNISYFYRVGFAMFA